MDIGTVIVSALKGVSKVFIIAAGGAMLSWRGILDLQTARGLSKINFNFVYPCLMVSSIFPIVNPDNFAVIGIILVCALFHVLILLSFGFLLRKVARVPDHFRNGIVVCTTFGNVGDLVLAMVLGVGTSAPFTEGATLRGLAYVMVYTVMFSTFQFTIGDMMIASEMRRNLEYKKLAEDLELVQDDEADRDHPENDQEEITMVMTTRSSLDDGDDDQSVQLKSQDEGALAHEREKMKRLHKFTSVDVLLENHHPTEDKPSTAKRFLARLGCHATVPHWMSPVLSTLWKLCTPPNASIVIGIVIGLITPVKHLFYNPGEQPPLAFIYDTFQLVGSATITLGITNLGGALAKVSFKTTKVPLRISLLICFVKLGVMPAIGIGAYYLLAIKTSVIPADDKMLIFVLMTECCVPTAQFLVSLYQIHGGDGNEVAGVMLLQYLLTILTMSFYVSTILFILQ